LHSGGLSGAPPDGLWRVTEAIYLEVRKNETQNWGIYQAHRQVLGSSAFCAMPDGGKAGVPLGLFLCVGGAIATSDRLS
jgi:hypothetical protein